MHTTTGRRIRQCNLIVRKNSPQNFEFEWKRKMTDKKDISQQGAQSYRKKAYKKYGFMIAAAGLCWVAFTYWLYYDLPSNAKQITANFLDWLPQLRGVLDWEKLNFWGQQLGDRLAFVMVISYFPMILVGMLTDWLEFKFGTSSRSNISKKSACMRFVISLIMLIFIHWIIYWNSYYGRRLDFTHIFMATAMPFAIGVMIAGCLDFLRIIFKPSSERI
jgi:hypothetical protein